MIDTLEDVEIEAIDEYPANESVKLFGPPGSGKTTNAAGRVATLLRDYDYDISDVAWITYRRSLAMDTLKRLARWGVIEERQLQDPTEGATKYIGTSHAVANRVVGGAGEVVDGRDKYIFAKNRNLKYSKSVPWEQPPGQLLFDVFTYARENLLDPTDEMDLRQVPSYMDLKEEYEGSVPNAYEDWLDYKDNEGKIMFWEQLATPLEENKTPRKPILVIDEYHDAYPLLAKLAEYWADNAEIVIAAGDPHQVVNTYDGADPKFYHDLEYPEVKLPTAWERPPYEHWYPATQVLANAHDPPEMDIRNSGGDFGVQRSPSFTMDNEEWSVPDPDEKHGPAWFVREHGKETMFLTRTTHQLDGVAKALEKGGVLFETPTSSDTDGWQAPTGGQMGKRVAVYNALQKITRLDPEAFGGATGLRAYGDEEQGKNPSRIVLEPEEAAALLVFTRNKYHDLTRNGANQKAKSWITAEESVTADEFNEYVDREFWGTYTQASRSTGYLINGGLERHFDALGDRDKEALHNALRHNRHPTEGELPTKVYTIHASKGNQAETVVVWDGITGRIRDGMRMSEKERKNEYRVWYVALTRSTNNLYVLKDGFDFTDSFLPKGRELITLAKQGREAAERMGAET